MGTPSKVAVVIYDSVELVDMNGPIDVFLQANGYSTTGYQLFTVATDNKPVISEGRMFAFTPDYTVDNCPEPDIIVIPGAMTPDGPNVVADDVISWLIDMSAKSKRIMSVCVGAFSFAKTGLLNGRCATTHYMSIGDLQQQYPKIDVIKNVRYVHDELFITTGGITSGIDGALKLIEILDGPAIAQQVADIMVYNRDNPLPPGTLLPPGATS